MIPVSPTRSEIAAILARGKAWRVLHRPQRTSLLNLQVWDAMRHALFVSLIALLTLAAPRPLDAQGTSDVITGQVTDANGAPIPGARVTALAAETEMTRTATTNPQGRFTLVFPDGGGQYRITVSYPGLTPVTRTLTRTGDQDVLIANVRLTPQPVVLEGVSVTARNDQPDRRIFQETATQERALTGDQIDRLPIDQNDLTSIATLTPGVVLVGDSLGNGFSVLGQGPSANQLTLDGATFAGQGGTGTGVPTEAIRVTRVITNSYDVSRGQFSGGQIATTTRSGTNVPQGSFTFNLRDPSLAWGGTSSTFNNPARQSRVSGGYGGPIVRSKLFYFGSLSWNRRAQDVVSLLSADEAALLRLGVSPDSVAHLLSLVSAKAIYGPNITIPSAQLNNNLSFLGRLDATLSQLHTLTLRLDGNGSASDGTGGQLGLPQSGTTNRSSGGGVMGTLTSRFGNSWTNELRVYGAQSLRKTEPYQESPAGRVRVSSDLSDGTRAVSSLSFGGGGAVTRSTSHNFETSDELSLLIGTTHRVRTGLALTSTRSTQESGSNRFGTFTFESIQDFAANRPSQFTRNLASQARESGGWNGSLYLGDTWRPLEPLQLSYGTRVETSRVAARPEYNPGVEAAFGLRTDDIPSEVAITPRVGFSYNLPSGASQAQGGAGGGFGGGPGGGFGGGPGGGFGGGLAGLQGAGTIRGGFGIFRSAPAWNLFAAARDLTGLATAQSQLICVGAAVPTPNWSQYQQDPAAVPSACVAGAGPGAGAGQGSGQRSNVAVFDPHYKTSQSWRASLGIQRRIWSFLGGSLDFAYAEGHYQQGITDLNLRDTAAFTLSQEGGRPVFVPAPSIVPATGQVSYLASRVNPAFGQVMEINSALRSRTGQATFSLSGFILRWRLNLSGSYNYSRSRDQGSGVAGFGGGGFGGFGGPGGGGGFGGGGASIGSLPQTGGNPNDPQWWTSSNDRRHALSLTAAKPFGTWLNLSVVGRATSGGPFSPLVGGDINGDGARNDLAFLFDPATTADPAVAAGMRRVLDGASGGVRACLESQLGAIAGRNSCRQPWSYSLDLRFNVSPALPQLGRRLTFSVDAINSLGALDQLLHGSGDLKGWGQQARLDPVLLYPRGFDRTTQSFRYEVNERFGSSTSNTRNFSNPFQIQLQGQLGVGRRPQGFGGGAGGGFGRGAGGGFGGGGANNVQALLARAFPNPVARILELADSLRLDLTPEQRARLTTVADSLKVEQDTLSAPIAAAAAKLTVNNANPQNLGAIFRQLQPRQQQSQRNVARALVEAQQILTPEQWERLPSEVKTPPQAGPGGGPGGGRPGAPGGPR
jgi:hypothetical protein